MSKAAEDLATAFGEADETVDLSGVIAEAWLALAFFWALGAGNTPFQTSNRFSSI